MDLYVGKKQARLTVDERRESSEVGDMYLWTAIDQRTKLMPSFLVGKRSVDNARHFLCDVSRRLQWDKPHASDAHGFKPGGYRPVIKISGDRFMAFPEAVDLDLAYTHTRQRGQRAANDLHFARRTLEQNPAAIPQTPEIV